MANESNLIPLTELTEEERRAMASKAGKASVAARRRKKSMKDAMNLLLSLPVDESNKAKMERLGIDPSAADNQMLMLISAFQQAVKGNVRAMEFIKDLTGAAAMTELDKKRLKVENTKIALEAEKIKIQKEKLICGDTEDMENDGFLEALNTSAKDDWHEEG